MFCLLSFLRKDWSRFYYLYLFLSVEAIGVSCAFHFSYLDYKTPQESSGELVSNVLSNFELATFFAFACALAVLLSNLIVSFYKREHDTPNSFCLKRYMMAAGMISINMLLTASSIFSLYGTWAKEIIPTVMVYITSCLGYIYIKIDREKEFLTHYRLSKTTTVTMSQNLFMIFFLVIFGAFNICSSFIELPQFPDEYAGMGFVYTTRVICPILYIITIPMIYVAFLAYNSEEFEFIGQEPTSGRFRYGVCRWNEKLGEWEYVETIPGETKPLVLDV